MAKKGVPISKKSTGRSQKSSRTYGGQRAVATKYNKPPSTTNVGTRPTAAPPPSESVRTNPSGKQVVANQAKVSPRLVAGPSTPSVTPTTVARKAVAAPIVKTPNVVNRAAAIAQNIAKQAANQQQHIAAVRTNMNHPTEVGGGINLGGGGGGGGGTSVGGGGGTNPTPSTPTVTTPTTPVVSNPAPPVVSPTNPTAPTNVGTFTSRGGPGTYGRFNRQRLNRGPRSGMSITPEMLQRIAAQRIGPT